MDLSDNVSCIKCDKGGNLLVCSEYGCPIAVHAGCLGCPARFDDARRFYCPYCVYKQAVAESHKAREQALARKKALMIFMEGKVIGSEKHMGKHNTCNDNGHNQSKTSPVNFTSRGNGKSKSNNNAICDQAVHLEEDSEASAGSKGQDPSVKMHGKKSNTTEEEKQVQEKKRKTFAEEEQVQETECETSAEEEEVQETERVNSAEKENTQEEEHETSVEEEKIQEKEHETSVEEEKTQEEEREASVEEEKIQDEESETSSASTDEVPLLTLNARAKRGSKRSRPVDIDSDVDHIHSILFKQPDKKKTSPLIVTPTRKSSRKSSLAVGSGKLMNEKVGSPRRLKKPEEPTAKRASNMLGSPKRKRLLWTKEEEDAIRAGVQKYLVQGNTNIPWKKILDSSHKFDATRTPCDLKDKWRNMSAR